MALFLFLYVMKAFSPCRNTHRYLCSLFFFAVFYTTLIAQDNHSEDTNFYREDQFYIGASLVLLDSNDQELNPRGISNHIQFGVIRDFPLSQDGRFATGLGIGVSFDRLNTNFFSDQTNKGITIFRFNDNENDPPLYLSHQSLEIPWSFRWRSSSPENYAFWRVYAGVSFQWIYRAKMNQLEVFQSALQELNRFNAHANLSFGYNTWNFYLSYPLSSFFNQKVQFESNQTVKLIPIKIGLIFYLL